MPLITAVAPQWQVSPQCHHSDQRHHITTTMVTVLRSQWGPQWSISPQCHHNDHSITTVPPQSMTTVLQQCHHSDCASRKCNHSDHNDRSASTVTTVLPKCHHFAHHHHGAIKVAIVSHHRAPKRTNSLITVPQRPTSPQCHHSDHSTTTVAPQ